jgi:hypothetical protein
MASLSKTPTAFSQNKSAALRARSAYAKIVAASPLTPRQHIEAPVRGVGGSALRSVCTARCDLAGRRRAGRMRHHSRYYTRQLP